MIIFYWASNMFYCASFGFIAEQEEVSENELISRQGIERFQIMGHETGVRGEQAGGWLVLASDSSCHVRFVGHKVVIKKTKESNLSPGIWIRTKASTCDTGRISTLRHQHHRGLLLPIRYQRTAVGSRNPLA